MHQLMYKTEMYRNLIFNISDKAPLNAILKYINLVDSGIGKEREEHIIYSTMELVNNSLRAQKEKDQNNTPVKLKFSALDDSLNIMVMDWGGGFDTALLPYDLNTPAHEVDLESTSFQIYREKYAYTRFGMGLLTARQLADTFDLEFHSKGRKMEQYSKGFTEGTIITMGIKWYD
jgi:anti-sigma regulatory factor (Ser/Thr protein kinase)